MLPSTIGVILNPESVFSFNMKEILDSHGIKYGEYIEDDFWDAMYSEKLMDLAYLSEESIIGRFIASGDECGLDESQTSVEELADVAKKVKEDIKKVFGLDVNVQLLTGERCC
ncbi:hypothetical protein LCGC14_2105020 [marine sediment metagenome]|uniref:Uncharacterized protein n=1 Tax=marine sediment metagenome TaxID=412755 RepID=A0A0F9EW20_9ZZZZ